MKKLAFIIIVLTIFTPVVASSSAHYSYSKHQAEELVSARLVAEGFGEKVSAKISSPSTQALFISNNEISAEVDSITASAETGAFSASIVLYNAGTVAGRINTSGKFEQIVMVPVLKSRISEKSIVTESDIRYIELPEYRLRAGAITKAEDMIGKQPRRAVSGNRPVRAEELKQADVIRKGDYIKVAFTNGRIRIEVNAEALEDAHPGQQFMARNTDSNKTIRATAITEGIAEAKQINSIISESGNEYIKRL